MNSNENGDIKNLKGLREFMEKNVVNGRVATNKEYLQWLKMIKDGPSGFSETIVRFGLTMFSIGGIAGTIITGILYLLVRK